MKVIFIIFFFYKSFIGVSLLSSWSKCDFRAFGAEREIIYQRLDGVIVAVCAAVSQNPAESILIWI